jgi:type I restriction enzyme S subunit
MMYHVRTKTGVLTSRLDVSFYNPDAISIDQTLSQFGTLAKLSELIDSGRDITNGVRGPDFQESDFRLIRLQDCEGFRINFCGCATISERQFNENRRCRVRDGDVIVAIGGYIGFASVATEVQPAVIGQHSAIIPIAIEKKVLPEYLVAYLNSKIGRIQFQRFVSGTVQQGINLEDIRHIRVPLPSRPCQGYIAGKVRNAQRLRRFAMHLATTNRQQMTRCFRNAEEPIETKCSRVPSFDASVNRLEAEYYQPMALWAEAEITGSKWPSKPLSALATRIKDGPGGWGVSTNDYVTSGVPVVRGVDLVEGDCVLNDCVFITPDKHRQLFSHCAKRGSVLLSVRGTIGRAAVFDHPEYEEASLNAAVVTIDCTDEVLPHFLAEYLETRVGLIQSQRIANGAVQQNMNLTETGSNMIVIPPPEFQQEVAARRQHRILTQRLMRALISSTKHIAEALVEKRLIDHELSLAESGLNAGDQLGDRAILSRLYEGGLDATDTQPLFPDLDAYYETLLMAEQALADGGQE